MKKWLSLLLVLCVCAPWALAEDTADADEVVQSSPVDAAVGEVTGELGGDVETPPEETYVEPPSTSWTWSDFYINYPDVYQIKNSISVSDRVYPGALVWPLKGTQPMAHVSSRVGWRNAARIHSGQGGTWPSWLHHGIDVGNVTTAQMVVAAETGIAYAGEQRGNGLYVVIDHGNGWYTKYQHLSRFAGAITDGCREVLVRAGDPIGYVGNSGGDYPVHFHFEIAWSPDGPGFDDETYHRETHNRTIHAYSVPQKCLVKLHWAERWEICSAEYQAFVSEPEELIPVQAEEE